jgi:hypothetical protein
MGVGEPAPAATSLREPIVRHTPLPTVLPTLLTVALATSVLAFAPAPAQRPGPLDGVVSSLDASACDPTDPAHCLFPFPSNFHTVVDEGTRTGLRVDFSLLGMPRNNAFKPVDPAEWNRQDGFSPGTPMLALVPDLDLARSWGVQGLPALQQPQLYDVARYLASDAPIVLLDTVTGARHPFFSEVDMHRDAVDGARVLQIRPTVNLIEGRRYIVALRGMLDSSGASVTPAAAFVAQRDGDADARFQRVFSELADAGVDRGELYLAWDFTVASAMGIAGRALSIRDEAFAELGDTDLADRVVSGDAPVWAVTGVEENPQADTLRRVHLTVDVANFLQGNVTVARPDHPNDDTPQLRAPVGGRFTYAADDVLFDHPLRDVAEPTVSVPFTCDIPATATADAPAIVSYYGHGLVGSRTQYQGSAGAVLRSMNVQYCSMEWVGLSTGDLPAIAVTLADVGNFPVQADRGVQGMLNQLVMGRALLHADGPVTDAAFADADGRPLFDNESLVYDGNSQGGIMGGALMALSPDLEYGVLGATGMNYTTLLQRSVDWEGLYGEPFYAAYSDTLDRQANIALMGMLWDRFESNGYAHHTTTDPYPNTPTHQVLLHSAWSDHQVTTVTAEIQARTYGASVMTTALRDGRHYSVDPFFQLSTLDPDKNGVVQPFVGSALVFFDSGNPNPPLANVPSDVGGDPHSHPRQDTESGVQRLRFLTTGEVTDVHNGAPYYTSRCAFQDDAHPAC